MQSQYLVNKLQDWFWRGQTFTLPANFYIALCTTTSTATAMGTEVSAGNYARTSITRNMTNFSGTQGLGTTTASTGSSGAVYNNLDVALGTPDVAWGDIASICIMDQATGGNMLEYVNLSTVKHIVNPGDPVIMSAGQLQSTLTSS